MRCRVVPLRKYWVEFILGLGKLHCECSGEEGEVKERTRTRGGRGEKMRSSRRADVAWVFDRREAEI